MRKWTDEEIDRVRMSPGFYWDSRFYNQAADHIKELQDAVEGYRCDISPNLEYAHQRLNIRFWPEDEMDEYNDSEIGHEW